ncbi:unnamed protein product [Haemonchus placei]|uniref:Uncharacterized protein n=1 Tax=Haemonchus placei TaxID=6290 RepID=A0A3P7Z799_HAEPC|nr:unnamed protein product [Haemonchus placei]
MRLAGRLSSSLKALSNPGSNFFPLPSVLASQYLCVIPYMCHPFQQT